VKNRTRTKTPLRSPRRLATAVVASIALATPSCFALFSLDGYGPPADPSDASPDVDGRSSAVDGGGDGGATGRGRTIFVTSSTFQGDFGTRDGGDSKCQAAAVDAGLTGSYRVWLSEDGASALDPLVRDAGPLRLPSGAVVAGDTAELAATGPRTGIVLDERGRKVGGGGCNDGGLVAWTGTAPEGGGSPFGVDCSNWRSNGTQSGAVGLVGGDTTTWTAACLRQCREQAALYCIQQ
jgi:hypothetical protein